MSEREESVALVDATGLTCPLPLLKAKQALNKLAAGEQLKVITTDPGSVKDFDVFAQLSGNKLLVSRQQEDSYIFLLQKT